MKKSLSFGLLALTASVVVSFGQGEFVLDTGIGSDGPDVIYGPGVPFDGVGGASGVVGSGLQRGWTMGFYYALGNVTGSVASDPTGFADPSTLGGGLILGTGSGSTATFYTSVGAPGEAVANMAFFVPGTAAGDTITLIVTAYNTSSGNYANANWRGHSTVFNMATGHTPGDTPVGQYMSSGFSVFAVPEPSTFALASLSVVAWFRFRHRK